MFTEILIQCSRPSNNTKFYSLFDCYFRFSTRLILVHNSTTFVPFRYLLHESIYRRLFGKYAILFNVHYSVRRHWNDVNLTLYLGWHKVQICSIDN